MFSIKEYSYAIRNVISIIVGSTRGAVTKVRPVELQNENIDVTAMIFADEL